MSGIEHEIQVTSGGGAGTSALLYHLHMLDLPVPRTPDWRPYKHQMHPPSPAEVPAGFRAIFMLSDPRDAVLSLFRRGFQHDHPNLPEVLTWRESLRLRRLRWWITGSDDLLGMEAQFARWLAAEVPVLYLSHSGVASHWPVVAQFLGAPDLPAPRWHDRRSQWEREPLVLRAGLSRIHGQHAERLDAIGPVAVNEPGRALVSALSDRVPVIARA